MLLVMLVMLLMLYRIFEVIPSPAGLIFLLSILSCIFPESPDNPLPPAKAKLPDNHGKDQVLGLPASPLTLISVWVASSHPAASDAKARQSCEYIRANFQCLFLGVLHFFRRHS